MSVEIEKLDGLQRCLNISIADKDISDAYNKTLQQEASKANIKGFRKGKVPPKVLEQQSGKAIRQHVVAQLVDDAFNSAVKEYKLQVAGTISSTPLPEILQPGEPVDIKVTIEVYPEVDLKDLNNSKVEVPVSEVTEADIESTIENLQAQYGEWNAVERAAEKDDKVTIDFAGTLVGESEAMENGSAEGHVMELGKANMIPGFEDGVIGMQPGETKTLQLKFPEDYHAKEIAGKDVEFAVTLHKVEQQSPLAVEALPEKLSMKDGGIEAVRDEIRKNLSVQLLQNKRALLKAHVLERLRELNPIDIPSALIDAEIKHMQDELYKRMTGGKGGERPDIDLPRDPFVKEATVRVANGLLLSEAVKKFDIKPDAAAVQKEIEERAQAFQDPQMFINYCTQDKNQMAQMQMLVLENQVIDKLLESASAENKNYTAQELTAALQELQKAE